jgi:protein-disulfide isomerase
MKKLALFFLAATSVVVHADFIRYGGKDINRANADAGVRQRIFEVEYRSYQQLKAIAEDTVLGMHFEEEAKKQKKTKEEIEAATIWNVKEPAEARVKAFYEENKAHIPPNYTYDQVKPQIVARLKEEAAVANREKLLASLAKKYSLNFKAPEPPRVDFKTDEYVLRKGAKKPKVTIVEFADYQCPHCAHASKALAQIVKKYPNKVQLIYVDFPVNRSGISRELAEAAYCAHKQNKYWEFHDHIYQNQAKLIAQSAEDFAKKFGIHNDAFNACRKSAEAKAYVNKGKEEGERLGVNGTPAVFINNQRHMGGHEVKDFEAAIKVHL